MIALGTATQVEEYFYFVVYPEPRRSCPTLGGTLVSLHPPWAHPPPGNHRH